MCKSFFKFQYSTETQCKSKHKNRKKYFNNFFFQFLYKDILKFKDCLVKPSAIENKVFYYVPWHFLCQLNQAPWVEVEPFVLGGE